VVRGEIADEKAATEKKNVGEDGDQVDEDEDHRRPIRWPRSPGNDRRALLVSLLHTNRLQGTFLGQNARAEAPAAARCTLPLESARDGREYAELRAL
jgi:hypothetical protein